MFLIDIYCNIQLYFSYYHYQSVRLMLLNRDFYFGIFFRASKKSFLFLVEIPLHLFPPFSGRATYNFFFAASLMNRVMANTPRADGSLPITERWYFLGYLSRQQTSSSQSMVYIQQKSNALYYRISISKVRSYGLIYSYN